MGHDVANFETSFLRVWFESLVVFFSGVNHFNSSLWTMRPELAGSLLVMLLAYFFRQALQLKNMFWVGLVVFLISLRMDEFLYPFLFGLYVAIFEVKAPHFKLSKWVSWGMFCFGLYLFGYLEPIGAYAWTKSAKLKPYDVYAVGGIFIVFAVVFCTDGYQYLAKSMGKFLGAYSFPIYLIHTTIIGSLSSWLLLQFVEKYPIREVLVGVFLATLLAVLFFSTLLVKIDDWWIRWLNSRMMK